eukprot:COSAG05_NODE_1589_length_4476_cov_118.433630_5_plen_302_part_00
MMVTGGGGGARPASIHDANGRGPRVPSHASLRMHALAVHPYARLSILRACTHRHSMHVSPIPLCTHSRCERPRSALHSTCLHSPSFYACESIHARGCLFDSCALTAFLCMRPDPAPPLVRPLEGALSIIQLDLGFSFSCSSLHSLVPKPAFNLHASMPVESISSTTAVGTLLDLAKGELRWEGHSASDQIRSTILSGRSSDTDRQNDVFEWRVTFFTSCCSSPTRVHASTHRPRHAQPHAAAAFAAMQAARLAALLRFICWHFRRPTETLAQMMGYPAAGDRPGDLVGYSSMPMERNHRSQ